MTQLLHGQQPQQLVHDNRGMILIISVLLVSVVMTVIGVSTALATLTHLSQNSEQLQRQDVLSHAHGCMEEALMRLHRDTTYTGESLTYGLGTCTIAILGSGNTRTLTVTGVVGSSTLDVTAAVTISPFVVTRWDS